ncbi:unnamed protein product [Lathyrus sativus]|nr:unnamed protein product [Lathyrus sativus]
MKNHADDDAASWLTLSLPSSSRVSAAAALSYEEQDMVNASSWLTLSLPPPPQPLPFEYRPLTPSLSPPNAMTRSNSEVMESPQTIQPPFPWAKEQDMVNALTLSLPPPQPQQLTPSLSPSNAITRSNSKVLESRQTIQPQFPWATLKPATIHTINHLLYDLNINTISGTLGCKLCKFQQTDVRFDLLEKFEKVANFIEEKKSEMFERAPDAWMKPVLPNCRNCGPKSKMRPLIGKNEEINWLFLFLGEMIGCCNLVHLKYFCQHANIHRSGAKDRLLYQTYLSLYKQLQPH